MTRLATLTRYLDGSMKLHRRLNSNDAPEDIDNQIEDWQTLHSKLFVESDLLWQVDGKQLAFHDRDAYIVSERRKGGKYHTTLQAHLMSFEGQFQKEDMPIEILSEGSTSLRPLNAGEVYKAILIPSENLMGFLYFEKGDWNKMRRLVVEVDHMDVAIGQGAILARKQGNALSSSTPETVSVRPRRRF